MKKIFTVLSAVLLSASLWAQAPQSFSYQAVVRGADNAFVSNKKVGMKISLLQGSEIGSAAYVETHSPTSNANGLVSIAIGGGTVVSGTFASIDWSKGPYFVKTETDLAGGTSYSLITTSQLMSVPFALYSANSQPGPKGDKGDIGATGPQGPEGTFKLGTTAGEMKYWDGTKWSSLLPVTNGQILTYCEGLPTWTFNGKCPNPTSGFGPNIADEDGNSYKTVYIGSQKWMAENLRTTKYNDGTMIPLVIDPTKWAENFNKMSTLPMMSWYNNDKDNSIATKYGALYNWYAITPLYNEDKNVCPTHWHLPSDDEWTVLLDFIAGDGGKLKKEGITEWLSPNSFATNTSGFSALPAGFRDEAGNYVQISTNGKWWSSLQHEIFKSNAWYRDLNNGNGALFRGFYDKSAGLSVRCVED